MISTQVVKHHWEGVDTMNTDCIKMLEEAGINYTEAMYRFGDNQALYERLALKFLGDPHLPALAEALEEGDVEQAFREAHSLKGVAGNLSFDELYEAAQQISDALRDDDLDAAKSLVPSLKEAHISVTTALTKLQG